MRMICHHLRIPISSLIWTLWEEWVPVTSASHNSTAPHSMVPCLSFLTPQDMVPFLGCYSPELCFPFVWEIEWIFSLHFSLLAQQYGTKKPSVWHCFSRQKKNLKFGLHIWIQVEKPNIVLSSVCKVWQELWFNSEEKSTRDTVIVAAHDASIRDITIV